MKGQSAERIILSQNQLKVLLKGSNYSTVKGITLDKTEIDSSVLANTLNTLVRRNMLTNNGENFVMSENIRRIINTIGESQGFVILRSRNAFLPDLCCYIGDKVLVCDQMKHRKNDVSFSVTDADTVIDELLEEGYFPFDEELSPYNENDLLLYDESLLCEINLNHSLREDSKIVFSAEISNINLEKRCYLAIVEYYLYNYIILFDGRTLHRELYSFSKIKQLIKEHIFCQEEN